MNDKIEKTAIPNKKKGQAMIHIFMWFIVLFVPYIIMFVNNIDLRKSFHFLLFIFSFIIVFYTNYLLLIDKFLFHKKYVTYALCNVILIVVCIFITQIIKHSFDFSHPGPPPPQIRSNFFKLFFYVREFIGLLAIAGLSVAVKATTRWYIVEREKQELEKVQLESELKNLKSQLNPHFLFNTLNNIYSLTITDTSKAQEGIQELSRLLRYVLYESNQPEVPLKKEIDFINSYINLMSLRINENTQLTVELPCHINEKIKIAPLLFISLIENAFKHGLKSTQESFIIIKISLHDSCIICSVLNSNFETNNDNKVDSGIGLDNLKKRLHLLYPDTHKLTMEYRPNAYYSELEIKLK